MPKSKKDKSFLHAAREAKKESKSKLFGAIDIETIKTEQQIPGTTALGGQEVIVTFAYQQRVESHNKSHRAVELEVIVGYVKTWDEFIKKILDDRSLSKITWYIHNMEFDVARMAKHFNSLLSQGYILSPIINGLGRFICIDILDDIGESFLKIRDSAAVLMGTLQSITDKLCPELPKLSGTIDFDAGEQFDILNSSHVSYAIRDSEALLLSMLKLNKLVIEHFGVTLRLTAASMSMQGFRVTLNDSKELYFRPGEQQRLYMRQAYFGGYVYLGLDAGNLIRQKLYHLDFSSCYPFCMRRFGVPGGRGKSTDTYKPGDIGIYTVTVKITDDHLPVCPLRTKSGVIWATGEYKTCLSSVDLENLDLQNIEYKVIEGITFDSIVYPFKKIVDKCEQLRKEYKGSVIEFLAKLIQNSLYGKFASNENLTEVVYSAIPQEEFEYQVHESTLSTIYGLSEDNIDLMSYKQVRQKKLDEDYLIIHWSVFITANARKHLHECMLIAGVEQVHYTDTDSIVTTETGYNRLVEAGKLGKEYGDLQLENVYDQFIAIAPKVYAAQKIDGTYYGRAKGVPKKLRNQEFFRRLLSQENKDEAFSFESVASLNSVMKGGELSSIRTRKLSQFANSSGWEIRNGQVKSKNANSFKDLQNKIFINC